MKIATTIDIIQSKKKLLVPEIRVWCHPKNGGDDYYYIFTGFGGAMKFIKENKKSKEFYVEEIPLIAFNGREINLWSISK